MYGQTIVRADKLFRKPGTAGGTITAGLFIVRSSTGWVAATAGQHAEAIAIDGAAPGEKFAYTDQSGIQVRSPLGSGGALAVNDLVYLYDSGTIYAGASNGYKMGYVDGTDGDYYLWTVYFAPMSLGQHAA